MAKKKRRKSITQQIMDVAVKELNKYQHDLTRQQYIRDFKRFVVYCRQVHQVKNITEAKAYIQEYVDYIINSNNNFLRLQLSTNED